MKGINSTLGIAIALGFILLSLANINVVRQTADALSSPQPPKTGEQMVQDITSMMQQNVTTPLWLLALVILLILILK